jgi:Arylsulfotransferase (ASST)
MASVSSAVHGRRVLAAACALFGSACLGDPPNGPGQSRPVVSGTVIAANPENVLSTVVTFDAASADSARAVFWSDSDSVATPYYAVPRGVGRIVTLGLRPNASYRSIVEAIGQGGATRSDTTRWLTASLPASLQGVRLELAGAPASGYLVTALTQDSDAFAVAFDRSGAIRWYRRFPASVGEIAIGSAQQSDNNFSVFVGASTGWEPVNGRYFEFAPDGEVVQSYTAGPPYYTDPHEMVLASAGTPTERVLLFGYDLRRLDLTAFGGQAAQLVAGHTILRQWPTGAVEFLWSAWDNFSVQDWVAIPSNLAQLTSIDFDHPSSLEIDSDGNYIVSFASMTEITKIDAVTGRIVWRFGGRHNQFTIIGDPLGGFGIQHDVRRLDNGDLLVYDNGNFHSPQQSRAVEYRLDTRLMTATLVWEYRHAPSVYTPFVGSAQRYQNGNTLVGFGAAGLMTEVTSDGRVVWEGRLTVPGRPFTLFYRVRKVPSLYRSERP